MATCPTKLTGSATLISKSDTLVNIAMNNGNIESFVVNIASKQITGITRAVKYTKTYITLQQTRQAWINS